MRLVISARLVGADVFLIAGQSNAQGGGFGYNAGLDTTNVKILQLPWGTPSLTLASEPLQHEAYLGITDGEGRVGFGLAFAREYIAQDLLAANRVVVLVPSARGSTSFTANHWNPGDTRYNEAVANANTAMSICVNPVFKGVLWHQGESDVATMTGSQYQTALSAMIDAMREDITGAANSAFVCGQMVPEWITSVGATAEAIDTVHADIANWKTKAAYWLGATGAGNVPPNQIHYNAAGQRLNGVACCNAYLAAIS